MLAALLREYPLLISTTTFVYSLIAKDPAWFLAFIWSFISMYANRGMKVLAIQQVEKDPTWAELLNRPGQADRPGMPSGHAQIGAAFFVFLALWLTLHVHQTPFSQITQTIILTTVGIIGYLVMQSRYQVGDGTKLQFVIGALIGGIFGLVPYYNLRLLPWTKESWLPAQSYYQLFQWTVLPALIFIVLSPLADQLGYGQESSLQVDDLVTERSIQSSEPQSI